MDGLTGNLFEWEVLGNQYFKPGCYQPRRKTIQLVKEHQPNWWNPAKPPTAVGRQLVKFVNEMIGGKVCFYKANNSSLDLYHGIDCFFENQSGKIVTIDLTINDCKDAYKADVIINQKDIYDNEGEFDLQGFKRKAQEIAEKFSS